MAGNHLRLHPGGSDAVAPESRSAVVALQIARTDAGGLDLDQCLTGTRAGYRHLLQAIVLGPMTDDSRHGLGNLTPGRCTGASRGGIRHRWCLHVRKQGAATLAVTPQMSDTDLDDTEPEGAQQ